MTAVFSEHKKELDKLDFERVEKRRARDDIASSTESPVYWLSHEHAQLSSSTPAVRRSSGVSLHASRKKKSGSSSTNAKTAAT